MRPSRIICMMSLANEVVMPTAGFTSKGVSVDINICEDKIKPQTNQLSHQVEFQEMI